MRQQSVYSIKSEENGISVYPHIPLFLFGQYIHLLKYYPLHAVSQNCNKIASLRRFYGMGEAFLGTDFRSVCKANRELRGADRGWRG